MRVAWGRRTMYVLPFCMGPLGAPAAKLCVQVTDSAYVVANLRIMTRMGDVALERIAAEGAIELVHSVGQPLVRKQISNLFRGEYSP